jgi:hypothetical protein
MCVPMHLPHSFSIHHPIVKMKPARRDRETSPAPESHLLGRHCLRYQERCIQLLSSPCGSFHLRPVLTTGHTGLFCFRSVPGIKSNLPDDIDGTWNVSTISDSPFSKRSMASLLHSNKRHPTNSPNNSCYSPKLSSHRGCTNTSLGLLTPSLWNGAARSLIVSAFPAFHSHPCPATLRVANLCFQNCHTRLSRLPLYAELSCTWNTTLMSE